MRHEELARSGQVDILGAAGPFDESYTDYLSREATCWLTADCT